MLLFIVYRNYRKKKKNRSQEDRRETKDISINTRQVFLRKF